MPGEPPHRASVPQCLYTPGKDGTRRKRKEAILLKKAKSVAAVIASARRKPTKPAPVPTGKGQKSTEARIRQDVLLVSAEPKVTSPIPAATIIPATPIPVDTQQQSTAITTSPSIAQTGPTLADRVRLYKNYLEWPANLLREVQTRRPAGAPTNKKYRILLQPPDGGPRWITIPAESPATL